MIYCTQRLHPKFNLDDDNFHLVTKSKNLFDMLQNKVDLMEWRASSLYLHLCKKLYTEGAHILINWEYYEKLADEGYAGDEIFLTGDYKTARMRQYKVYDYVFGDGFKHFYNVTMENGHNINGTQYIISTFEKGVYFKVLEPFGEISYLKYMIK